MKRILLVETASPQRVRHKAETLLADAQDSRPELSILCTGSAKVLNCFSGLSAELIPLNKGEKASVIAKVRAREFDIVYVFWTGEARYRGMKRLALRLGGKATNVDIGDGGEFRLTWKAFIRFCLFRLRHRLPADHYKFVTARQASAPLPHYPGENVMIIQSAEPVHVLRALERLRERPLFRNARYTLFCRNRPEIVKHFTDHPMVYRLIAHSEAHGAFRHLRAFRRERYDAVILFLTGDPSYWKIKYFAFLLGSRHKVIFNENNDCFYFNLRTASGLLAHRLGERSRIGIQPRWTYQIRILVFLLLKVMILPFRFLWLLGVWFRLRFGGLRTLSGSHEI